MTLHDELGLLADTAPRPTIDPSVWDRGRALRRRDRLVTSAVALAMVVVLGGVAALVLGPQQSVEPANGPVPDGAIPSRILDVDTDSLPEEDLAIGQASAAFVSRTGDPVVIGATDGRYHRLDIAAPLALALSPDGFHLAWSTEDRLHGVDLRTGETANLVVQNGSGGRATELAWTHDSARVTYRGTTDGERVAGSMEFAGPSEFTIPIHRTVAIGLASPARTVSALTTSSERPDAVFVRPATSGPGVDSDDSEQVLRALPADLYPDGAAVRPLGWAADDLVLAEVDAPAGSYVEGKHLALFTSPDRPESEWTYRIVMRDLPSMPVSIAVDLVPDLDGKSAQVLTHDFGDPDLPGDSPVRDRAPAILGGLAALLAGLAYLRMLRRQ